MAHHSWSFGSGLSFKQFAKVCNPSVEMVLPIFENKYAEVLCWYPNVHTQQIKHDREKSDCALHKCNVEIHIAETNAQCNANDWSVARVEGHNTI